MEHYGPENINLVEPEAGIYTVLVEHWGEGSELMQHWPDSRSVILVDAARSGAVPGTIHRFDALREAIPKQFCYYSTHRFGVAEAVELARTLGRLPARICLYAIEGESFDLGSPLSSAVTAATEEVAGNIVATLSNPHR